MRHQIENLLIKMAFRKYRNSLPTQSNNSNPKMEYHVLADAIVWEDEGIEEFHPKLGSAFRSVLNYRTDLIVGEANSNPNKNIFKTAKKYFPNWIGFDQNRCSYNPELANRIKRIRKVSHWKIDRVVKEEIQIRNKA